MTEVDCRLKPDPEPCACGCGLVGAPKKKPEGHIRGCKCIRCRNKNNRAKGHAKQAVGRRTLEQVTGLQAAFAGRKTNEETWDHLPVRVEAKAGKSNGANSVWLHFQKARDQAEAARPIGDSRPTLVYFAPDGVNHGVFVIEETKLRAVMDALGGTE